jgi:ATP-binding protein involved in chromosome partitioning
MGAVRQLISDVDWGALDVLVIDTPPGTGDAHLSLAQSRRLTGAVIVSTPQEMALADVRRGVELFAKMNVPVLGIIENMAWLEGADGARNHLFGKGGAEKAAADLGVAFLGALPIYPDLRIACDEGEPIACRAPASAAAAAFDALAEKIAARLTP